MYIVVDEELDLQEFVKLPEKLTKAHLLATTKAINSFLMDIASIVRFFL